MAVVLNRKKLFQQRKKLVKFQRLRGGLERPAATMVVDWIPPAPKPKPEAEQVPSPAPDTGTQYAKERNRYIALGVLEGIPPILADTIQRLIRDSDGSSRLIPEFFAIQLSPLSFMRNTPSPLVPAKRLFSLLTKENILV